MIRTQVYLTPRQHRALRRSAKEAGVSMTEMLRRILAEHFAGRRGIASFDKETVLAFAALGRSGLRDVAERHDEALDEALRAPSLR
jgi:predicted HicB family RNase H-like nuclease